MAANIPANGIVPHIHVNMPILLRRTFCMSQDRNQDDDELISITEFSIFVFPESSSALEEEKTRIQKLKEEVS